MKENSYKSESPTVNETNGVISEMILLGNIMHNSGLISEYADALSTNDFSDAFCRYVYEVLRNYYMLYGAEEVQQEHFNCIAFKLLEETGLKCPGISMKNLWKEIHGFKRLGALQPADNEAYQDVKRYQPLRQA